MSKNRAISSIYLIFIIFLSTMMLFSIHLDAKKRKKGILLKIEEIESGKTIKGELLEVKEKSLLILTKRSGLLSGENVVFEKIDNIMMKRRNKIGKWTLYGLVVGSAAGILTGSTQTYGPFDTHGRAANMRLYGVAFGILGTGLGVIGGTVDSLIIKYKEIYNKDKWSKSSTPYIALEYTHFKDCSIKNCAICTLIQFLNKKARYTNSKYKKK